MLQLSKLFNLVQKLPVANELEGRLEQEMDRQKLRFNNKLKAKGYKLDDPRVEAKMVEHTVSLYNEMSVGLNTCARELENQLKASGGKDQEMQQRLSSLQKQIGQISLKMGAYAQAVQQDQKVREKELAKQRDLDKRYLELERKKEKQKELEKEQEKAKQWDKLLDMILPAAWHASWKQKTEEKINALHAELGEGKERSPEQVTRKPEPPKKVMSGLFSNVSVGSQVHAPEVPMTFEAKLRRMERDKDFLPPKS